MGAHGNEEQGKSGRIPVTVFEPPSRTELRDARENERIVRVIREGVLPRLGRAYHSVGVHLRRRPDGQPEYLIAYLQHADDYGTDVVRVAIDSDYTIGSVEEGYDDTGDPDDDLDEDSDVNRGTGPEASADFVVATPVPDIASADRAVDEIYDMAVAAGLTTVKLKGQDATLGNYKKYLTSGVRAFVSIGHGYNNGILLSDGRLRASWFSGLLNRPLSGAVIYFNSCEVFHDPMKAAVVSAGSRTYVGGFLRLPVGRSEASCKCFWNRCLAGRHEMGNAVETCELIYLFGPLPLSIEGDRGPFWSGHVVLFEEEEFRGRHRHVFVAERNLALLGTTSVSSTVGSFVVESGTWEFFRSPDFANPAGFAYAPGMYPRIEKAGMPSSPVLSMRCIKS